MSWQAPKTDWSAADGVRDTDMNRIEGNIQELYNTAVAPADITLYVSTTGNDISGTGTEAAPYATISKALSSLQRNLGGKTVSISIATGTYAEEVIVRGFTGGSLQFTGSILGAVTLTKLTVDCCTLVVRNISITAQSVSIINGANLVVYNDISTTSGGVTLEGGSSMHIGGYLISNHSGTSPAILAYSNSFAYATQVRGRVSGTALRATSGSVICYDFITIQAGLMHDTSGGGRIYTGSQSTSLGVNEATVE